MELVEPGEQELGGNGCSETNVDLIIDIRHGSVLESGSSSLVTLVKTQTQNNSKYRKILTE